MANKLSKKAIKFIGFAGIGILLLGGGVLVGNPLLSEISGQTAELKTATANTDTLKNRIATLTKLKTDNPAVDKINVALLTQFPELANVPALLDSISASADTAGISADNITNVGFTIPKLETATPSTTGAKTPDAPAAKADAPAISSSAAPTAGGAAGSSLASMDVSITVKGDTGQFQVFLKQLTSMGRVFTVKTFNIAVAAATPSGPGGSLTISGTTYLYKHIQAPLGGGAAVTNTSGTATNPNNSGPTANPANPSNPTNPTNPSNSVSPTRP